MKGTVSTSVIAIQCPRDLTVFQNRRIESTCNRCIHTKQSRTTNKYSTTITAWIEATEVHLSQTTVVTNRSCMTVKYIKGRLRCNWLLITITIIYYYQSKQVVLPSTVLGNSDRTGGICCVDFRHSVAGSWGKLGILGTKSYEVFAVQAMFPFSCVDTAPSITVVVRFVG